MQKQVQCDITQQQGVLGVHDKIAKQIENAFDVSIQVREAGIEVKGEQEEQVARAAATLDTLVKMYSLGEAIDEMSVTRAMDLVDTGEVDSVLRSMKDAIVINHRGQAIKCRTVGQKKYIEALKNNTITICIGPAGTGKTYLAVAVAVDALRKKQVDRIIMARPAVEAGEKLGFLPGDLQNKVDPYLRPLYDALDDILGPDKVKEYQEKRIIEVAPLAYMRGRTLNRAHVIIDEAQNAQLSTLKMALTRLGEGSKMVVTGDVTQIDLIGAESGLETCAALLTGIDGIAVVRLNNRDVVRHKLVQEIVKAFEGFEEDKRPKVKPRQSFSKPGAHYKRKS